MPVNTAKVHGRRPLQFHSLDEVLADADHLAAGPIRCLGNWSAGQIFKHLAITLDNAVDGVDFRVPWFVRLIARTFKNRFLYKPMSPGFRMPRRMEPYFAPPAKVELADGLQALHRAVARYKAAERLAPSAALGPLTRAEYDALNLRHAEMHLSFLVPDR